jgi:glutaredoxin
MKKITIYTNEQCPYCKQLKEEFTKENVKFNEKLTVDYTEEWEDIQKLVGMATVPTVYYKDEYFVAGRDFGTPHSLIKVLKRYKPSSFDNNRILLEKIKTLNYQISMAFNRTDQLLRKIENKLNIKENEHKSTS